MTKKTSKARTEAFFAALSETGDQTIAAEQAGVSRSWAGMQARLDAGFKARMEACADAAHARLSGASGIDPSAILGPAWSSLGGDPLVIRMGKSGRMQVMRAPDGHFTSALEPKFLAGLQATNNVAMTYNAIGMTSRAVYEHRKRWPGFDRRWKAAADRGALRLDVLLICNRSNAMRVIEIDYDMPIPPMTVDQMMHQIYMHQYAVRGVASRRACRRGLSMPMR